MMRYKSAFLLLIACLFWSSAHAQTRQENEVLQTLKRYDEAWNKKDSAAVGKILAENYVYFTSVGGISTRQQTLDFLISPKYVLTFVERSEIKHIKLVIRSSSAVAGKAVEPTTTTSATVWFLSKRTSSGDWPPNIARRSFRNNG